MFRLGGGGLLGAAASQSACRSAPLVPGSGCRGCRRRFARARTRVWVRTACRQFPTRKTGIPATAWRAFVVVWGPTPAPGPPSARRSAGGRRPGHGAAFAPPASRRLSDRLRGSPPRSPRTPAPPARPDRAPSSARAAHRPFACRRPFRPPPSSRRGHGRARANHLVPLVRPSALALARRKPRADRLRTRDPPGPSRAA